MARDFSGGGFPAMTLGALGILELFISPSFVSNDCVGISEFVSPSFSKFGDIQSKIHPPNLVLARLGEISYVFEIVPSVRVFLETTGSRKAKNLRPIVFLCVLFR